MILEGESEFEKFLGEWDEEGAEEDSEDEDHEDNAKEIEGPRDFVNEEEVDGEDNDSRKSGEFGAIKIVNFGNDRKNNHRNGDGNTCRHGIVFDVVSEFIFDPGGVFLERQN